MIENTAIDDAMSTLEALAYKDLKSIRTRIDTMLDAKRREAEAEFERRRQQLALEFDLDDRPKRKSNIRYRDLDNPDQTWSGRGRQPQWVADKLEAGMMIEQLEA